MELSIEDKLYSSTEVCEILGISLRTLYRYMASGNLESMQTPTGRHRFTKKQIEDFLERGGKRKESGGVKFASSVVQEEATQPSPSAKEEEAAKPEAEEEVEEKVEEEKVEQVEEKVEDIGAGQEEREKAEEKESEGAGISLAYKPKEQVEEVEEKQSAVSEIYYKSEIQDIRELARKIKEVSDNYRLDYAFSGMGGLSLHYPIRPFDNLLIYISKENLEDWVRFLGLEEASKVSANLKVKFNGEVLSRSKELGGLRVVDDETLMKDLEEMGQEDLVEEFRSKL